MLLSPGGTSFDEFTDFEERGKAIQTMGEGTYVAKQNNKAGKPQTLQLPFDVPLLLVVVVLLVFGLLMVYSASWDFSILMGEGPTYIFSRQLLWVFLGLVAAVIATFINYHFYQKILIPMWFGTLLLLLAVLIVNEGRGNEATRMLLSGSIQPSELAKAVIIIYLSFWLYRRLDSINNLQIALVPLVIILGVTFALIMMQPDLSAGRDGAHAGRDPFLSRRRGLEDNFTGPCIRYPGWPAPGIRVPYRQGSSKRLYYQPQQSA